VGIALVFGVLVNYINDPKGNVLLLFVGVGLVVIAILLDAIAFKKMSKTNNKVSSKGIILSVAAGVLMSLFYYFVAKSMFANFSVPEPGKLSPYTALFFFAVGVFVSNFLFNTIFMKNPVEGRALNYSDYFKGGFKSHIMGILGGIIWILGMSLNILASGKAGFAISYGLGQGATLVAAIWGVFIWKEFKGADKKVNNLIALMFLAYLGGLACIILAGV
jgi:glucose uptake protein